jgi:hypothetical protein
VSAASVRPDGYTKDQVTKTFWPLNAPGAELAWLGCLTFLPESPGRLSQVTGALMCLLAVTIFQRLEPLAPQALLNGQQIEH